MSKASQKNRSKAPTGTVATNATGSAEPNAVAVAIDTTANPSGVSVPDGTNTPQSESGAAAGSASADQVKPHDQDGTSTPGTVTDATNSQSAPAAEAAASGDSASNNEPTQGAAEAGAGNLAGSGDASALFGVDLALPGSDRTVFSWFDTPVDAGSHPHLFGFIETVIDRLDQGEAFGGSIRIKAKTNGFRRGGIAHSEAGQDFAPENLSAAQLEAILGEPELTVEIV